MDLAALAAVVTVPSAMPSAMGSAAPVPMPSAAVPVPVPAPSTGPSVPSQRVHSEIETRRRKKKKKKKKRKPTPTPTPPAVAIPLDQAKITHLLRRVTFGPTPSLVAEVRKLGWTVWLDRQLNHATLADPGGDTVRGLYPEMGRNVAETRASMDDFSWDSMMALGQATLGLSIWSQRQLFEVMTEFWSNHLNVTNPSDRVWDNRADYDRTVIRANALGSFSDMLVASATHPAMLEYLNNASSTKSAPNENYGRELLELHTVGVDAGYTEADVLTSARIMTGWTTDDAGEAEYRTSRHWKGAVEVMGFTDGNATSDGRAVAEAYLRHLARHPETARRIATKLCLRFVSDTVSSTLVARLAAIYIREGTAIKPVLTALFNSPEFWAASEQKIRRPYEDLVATIRVLGHQLLPASDGSAARRDGLQNLYWMVGGMRQAPLAWSLPNGYPDVAGSWRAADIALSRLNSHRSLVEGWWPNDEQLAVVPPANLLPTSRPSTYGQLIDLVSARLIFRTLPTPSRNAVLAFFDKTASSRLAAGDEILQWRAGTLATLILDSPQHGIR